jgi:hypothetical protein
MVWLAKPTLVSLQRHSGVPRAQGKLSRIAGVSLDAAEVLQLVSKLDVPVEDEELVVETVKGGAEEVGEKRRGDAWMSGRKDMWL